MLHEYRHISMQYLQYTMCKEDLCLHLLFTLVFRFSWLQENIGQICVPDIFFKFP